MEFLTVQAFWKVFEPFVDNLNLLLIKQLGFLEISFKSVFMQGAPLLPHPKIDVHSTIHESPTVSFPEVANF